MPEALKSPEPGRSTGRTRILVERTGQRSIVRTTALWVVLAVPVLPDSPGDVDSPVWWRLAGVLALLPVVAFRDRAAAHEGRFPRAQPVRWLPLFWCASAVLSLISPWFSPSVFVMSYLAGRNGGKLWKRPVEAAVAVSVVLTALGVIGHTAGHLTTWLNSTPLLVGAVTAWLAGRHRQQRRELEAEGWQRARQLEREHRLVADRARIRERARIAQDMHDQLGHDLTLIAMQAAALEVAPRLDEETRSKEGELRRSTAEAVGRLSDIIGVLRVEAAQEETAPREDRART
ncbi:histidine kinase dimerization/phosphoacceptor domain-containing protein [Streptomyces sp. NPDC048290]|uniref:histidine kinase dimerization/phosphoacceptor domain-containing protein n=1 Tax=Streptomyces sp. NPDC048290 TaxID=3155811 RepID=UPI00341C4B42